MKLYEYIYENLGTPRIWKNLGTPYGLFARGKNIWGIPIDLWGLFVAPMPDAK
jgi:hypothetical protein